MWILNPESYVYAYVYVYVYKTPDSYIGLTSTILPSYR